MRSHEERVAETKRRIAKMEREKQRRRNTITMASAVAACLALQPFLPLNFGDAPLRLRDALFMTPHL